MRLVTTLLEEMCQQRRNTQHRPLLLSEARTSLTRNLAYLFSNGRYCCSETHQLNRTFTCKAKEATKIDKFQVFHTRTRFMQRPKRKRGHDSTPSMTQQQ